MQKLQPLEKRSLQIDNWKGESVIVANLPIYTSLFYEVTTGYIYCPVHMDHSSTVLSAIVAHVDDYGNINAVLPGSEYRLQKEWLGFTILHPIAFCCKLWKHHYDRNLYDAVQLEINDMTVIIETQKEVIKELVNQVKAETIESTEITEFTG